MTGTIAIFFGIALASPFVVGPLVRVLSWPLRRLFRGRGPPRRGRRALEPRPHRGDGDGADDRARARRRGELVGASFLRSIEEEFDRSFARDLTVQPRGFAPG